MHHCSSAGFAMNAAEVNQLVSQLLDPIVLRLVALEGFGNDQKNQNGEVMRQVNVLKVSAAVML